MQITLKTKPTFDNGVCKWYLHDYINKYIKEQNAFNLLPIENMACFIVKGYDVDDLVLIDDKQNVVKSYFNTVEGYEQMLAFINMIKISKYYDNCEGKL